MVNKGSQEVTRLVGTQCLWQLGLVQKEARSRVSMLMNPSAFLFSSALIVSKPPVLLSFNSLKNSKDITCKQNDEKIAGLFRTYLPISDHCEYYVIDLVNQNLTLVYFVKMIDVIGFFGSQWASVANKPAFQVSFSSWV